MRYVLSFLCFVFLSVSGQFITDDMRLNDDTTGAYCEDPVVWYFGKGNAVVVWEDGRYGGVYNPFCQFFRNYTTPLDSNKIATTMSPVYSGYYPKVWGNDDSCVIVYQNGHAQWFNSLGETLGSYINFPYSMYEPDVVYYNGYMFMVWRYSYDIYFQIYEADGDSVSSRILVNDDGTGAYQYDPNLALSPGSGKIIVVWRDNRNSGYDIFGQYFDLTGSKIGVNFLINDDGVSAGQYSPDVCMDYAGNAFVVWQDSRNGNYDIYAQIYDTTGSPVGSNFLVNDDGTAQNQYGPSCSCDSAGNYVWIVWYDWRSGSCYHIYGQIYDMTGSAVDTNFQISENTGTSVDAFNPGIINRDTLVYVVWHDERGYMGIYMRIYREDGALQSDEIIVDDISGARNQQHPSVGMNDSGRSVIAWWDYRPSSGIYWTMCDTTGDTLGTNREAYYGGYSPSITVFPSGRFIIVANSYHYIRENVYDSNGNYENGFYNMADDASAYKYDPSIDNNGEIAVVVWEDRRNGDYDIYCTVVDSSGDTTGDNVRIDDAPSGTNQRDPDISMIGSGKFLVVWEDRRDGSDIYGRIFNPDKTPATDEFMMDDDAKTSYDPAVDYMGDGRFVVVWRNASDDDISCAVIDTLGNVMDTFSVDSSLSGQYPDVACGSDGRFVIVWYSFSYSTTPNDVNIFSRKYDSALNCVSSLIKVNNDEEGVVPYQYYPSVAIGGDYVFYTWEDAKWNKALDIAGKLEKWVLTGIDEVNREGIQVDMACGLVYGRGEIKLIGSYSGDVRVRLYDSVGRVVKVLYEGKLAGNRVFSIGGLASGVYYTVVEYGDKEVGRKFVFIK